jgi:hypothetical protein
MRSMQIPGFSCQLLAVYTIAITITMATCGMRGSQHLNPTQTSSHSIIRTFGRLTGTLSPA